MEALTLGHYVNTTVTRPQSTAHPHASLVVKVPLSCPSEPTLNAKDNTQQQPQGGGCHYRLSLHHRIFAPYVTTLSLVATPHT